MISLLQIGIETYMMLHRRIYVINQVKIQFISIKEFFKSIESIIYISKIVVSNIFPEINIFILQFTLKLDYLKTLFKLGRI